VGIVLDKRTLCRVKMGGTDEAKAGCGCVVGGGGIVLGGGVCVGGGGGGGLK